MDDFSWGTTRRVVGEGNKKTVVYDDDEVFTDSMIPYKSFKGESFDRTCHSIHGRLTRQTTSLMPGNALLYTLRVSTRLRLAPAAIMALDHLPITELKACMTPSPKCPELITGETPRLSV